MKVPLGVLLASGLLSSSAFAYSMPYEDETLRGIDGHRCTRETYLVEPNLVAWPIEKGKYILGYGFDQMLEVWRYKIYYRWVEHPWSCHASDDTGSIIDVYYVVLPSKYLDESEEDVLF
jgi:hypothetical protein